MKVIIIDDELYARKALEDKLTSYCPALEIVAIAENGSEGYSAIMEHDPDIVFLDIAMPQESGFDMLNRFEEITFETIFVTGFDEYAINAIEFSAIGYILKPINPEELVKSIHNAKKRIGLKKENDRVMNLLENLKHTSSSQRIAIPTMTAIEFIKASDIIRFEGLEKLTSIFVVGNRKIVSSSNIGEYRKILANHNFYSPHKSHLINMEHIKKYLREGTIVMDDNVAVPVSKRRKADFLKIMKSI